MYSTREVAANVSLPGVRSIAVLPFSGKSYQIGTLLADKISMSLSNAQHFTIVERSHLDRVLSEQNFSLSGLTDDMTGAKVGQLVNSDAVITGNISVYEVKNTSHYQKTKKGSVKVYDRFMNLTVNIKIILTKTGTLVFSRAVSERDGGSHSDPNLLPSPDVLFEKCSEKVASYIRFLICPSFERVRLNLDQGDKSFKEVLKPGINFVKNNLYDRALEFFKEMAKQYPNASAPLFNQGVLLFQLDYLDEAEQMINLAIDLHATSVAQKTTGASLSTYAKSLRIIQDEQQNRYRLITQKEELIKPTETSKQEQWKPSDLSWRGKVRIAVVIPEILIRRQVPDPAGETKIIQTLIEAGFRPIEQTNISYLRYTPEVAAAIEDATAAAALARKLKVDVIVIGEAFGEEAGESAGFQSWRARLEARAIYSDTQEIICALSEYGSGADISDAIAGKKALENAGAKVGQLLVKNLDEYHSRKEGLTAGTRASRDQAKILRVIVEWANIRMEPNTASAIVAVAKLGEDLKLIDTGKRWFYIQRANGTEGWIHASLVKEIK